MYPFFGGLLSFHFHFSSGDLKTQLNLSTKLLLQLNKIYSCHRFCVLCFSLVYFYDDLPKTKKKSKSEQIANYTGTQLTVSFNYVYKNKTERKKNRNQHVIVFL